MDCLIDYIGLKGCGDEVPESGLYINTLPGISLESVDKVANSDQITYAKVWEDVQIEAWAQFSTDFFNELLKCYDIKPYCDYDKLICDNKDYLALAWKYCLGYELMLYRLYTSRLNYFTTVTSEEAKELMTFYQTQYEAALAKAAKFIDVSECCLNCGGNPKYVMILP